MNARRVLPLVCVSLLWAIGCAQERPPIDRVQPNYYDKAFFIGADYKTTSDDPEFWSQATLVDVGYGAAQDGLFTSTYAQPMSRVKWSITENLLIARLAYERVQGSDGKGTGKATENGIVVAAFPITKHFDVQRTYNPSTGEQLNVLEENASDRPWDQRQYIRVDWSKNLSTDNYDFDTLSMLGVYGGVSYEPMAYYVNDPASDDAPHFDGEGGYLDVTNKAFAKPQLVDLRRWGLEAFPACMFDADVSGGTAPSAQCSPVELTIRQAFRKVVDNDYEPLDWDGNRFQAYGAFTTERKGYARNYGMTDAQLHRFINRYNIWKRSHYYTDADKMTGEVKCYTPQTTPAGLDANRDLNFDGTADECASVGNGSQCDTFKQRCTLPFRQRQPVTIAWYLASGSNLDFFEPTRDATHEWDVALRSSIMTARYAECVRVGGADCAAQYPVYRGQQEENEDAINLAKEVDDCRDGRAWAGKDCLALADELGKARSYSAGVIALAKMDEMIVTCHSPVEARDPVACGTPRLPEDWTARRCADEMAQGSLDAQTLCGKALTVRRGDLRHHQINALPTPQTPSPWGIMVDSNDPLTGEVVAASINVWTHVNDLWSQGVVDTARYIKGELTTSDVTEGTYVRDWASAARAASTLGTLPHLTGTQKQSMIAELLGTTPLKLEQGAVAMQSSPVLRAQARALDLKARDLRADATAPTNNKAVYESRRIKAMNTPTEAALITKMMQQYAGNPGVLGSDALMALASPMRAANPALQREMRQARHLALAARGACVMDSEAPAPLGIANLADQLEAKFGKFDPSQSRADQMARAAKMQKYLAQRAHYAVITHEMGHSVGLRHNFVSSSDAFNYRPQYWQLRTDNGANKKFCGGLVSDGSCVGPRYYDPKTDNERNNIIEMFMQSSTMDYAGEATQDLLGLGAYDFAAARMFYGDVVSVYLDPNFKLGTARGAGVLEKMDSFGGILGFRPTIGNNDPADPTATTQIHYSQLQQSYELVGGCRSVDPQLFKPAAWDTATLGEWNPLIDGLLVSVNGTYSRCRTQPVDYANWNTMRTPTAQEVSRVDAANAIDPQRRLRVPYGFATDRWADLGNLAVYRHDNGADPYEVFDFLITQQEVMHVFDNYRRGRQSFTVRGAANRTLSRYNEKIRDGAKGLGLMANVYREFAIEAGYDFTTLWPLVASESFSENILASGMAFDHFAKQMARPQAGPHVVSTIGGQRVLTSTMDTYANAGPTAVIIPNGATGYFGNVAYGGRLLENQLATDKGEYNSEYTVNAGSYYDKAYTAMLLTESVDNFISASRNDFLDARYRAVSMADLFPDGYRRWLANNLVDDPTVGGARVVADTAGNPVVEKSQYPAQAMGWPTWWKATPDVCFQQKDTLSCATQPANVVPVDPQVGWEQQKFLIAWTLMYLPENQQQTWLNQLNIWEKGADSDPGFGNRIELNLPDGKIYVAKTFGRETLYGKEVEKGIAARMLEWGNQLLFQAYETEAGPDLNNDTKPDWYTVKLTNGQPRVKWDSSMKFIDDAGMLKNTIPGCTPLDNSQCPCTANRYCTALKQYQEAPFFMRQAMRDYGLADPSMKGLY